MKSPRRIRILCIALCGILLLCLPGNATDTGIVRSYSPQTPQPGELITVTLTLPPSFYGGIVEILPGEFAFANSSNTSDGARQSGQNVIFAVTGEEKITYTIIAPAEGCGVIRGTWENIETRKSGEIASTVIAVEGSDPSQCNTSRQSPGFSALAVLGACTLIGVIVFRKARI
ncbi:MAG: hypothetical protein ABFC24_03035 [Methanoregulaceae archaeon]